MWKKYTYNLLYCPKFSPVWKTSRQSYKFDCIEEASYQLKGCYGCPAHKGQNLFSRLPATGEPLRWTDHTSVGQQLFNQSQNNIEHEHNACQNSNKTRFALSHCYSVRPTHLLTFNPEVLCQFMSKSSSAPVPDQGVTVQCDTAQTSHTLKLRMTIPQRLCPCSTMPLHSLMLRGTIAFIYNSLFKYRYIFRRVWVYNYLIITTEDRTHSI